MAPEAGGEDIRSVLSEIISKHLGCRDLWKVFSGFADDPKQHFGLIKVYACSPVM